MKIYFAHPVSDYGQPREKACLDLIKKHFPDAEILNPNQLVHNEAYKTQGMEYFENLVQSCDALVFTGFEDAEVGMGVFREAEVMGLKGGKIYELKLYFGATLENAAPCEIDYKNIRPLSIDETRRRVRTAA